MKIITIAITTYNRWGACRRAIASVCDQVKDLEIILVDDCSTDKMTDEVREVVASQDIVYIRHSANRGLASARNSAIRNASGKFFAFCDDDDIWSEGMGDNLLRVMEEAPSGVGVAIALPPEDRPQAESFFEGFPSIREVILRGYTPPVSSQLYETELVRRCGGFTEQITSGVDHDLWISLAIENPRVGVSWRGQAIVGSESHSRMTTDETRRRVGIRRSLELWRPKILNVFGAEFYAHFYEAYEQYLNYKSLCYNLQRRNYGKSFLRLFKLRTMTVITKKVIAKLCRRKRVSVFPAYRGPLP